MLRGMSVPAMWRNRSPGDLSIKLAPVEATPVAPVIAAAAGASKGWARTPLAERVERLRAVQRELAKHKDELARGIALETG